MLEAWYLLIHQAWWFFYLFHSFFPKTALFITLKKCFSKSVFAISLFSVFISLNCFNQAFWLNLMTLCTFSIQVCDWILDLNALCLWQILFYHAHWLPIFFKQKGYIIVTVIQLQNIKHQLQKISFITILSIAFYKTFTILTYIFNPLKNCLQAIFVTLLIHISYLHPNTQDRKILYFYHNRSFIYY